MKQTRYASGVQGEAAAEAWLTAQGMTCLQRRYRAGDGEIDLIMRDGAFTVFVEVKFRPDGQPGAGLLAVTPAKRRRIIHAARYYLLKNGCLNAPCRFDVIEINAQGILHIPNAFPAAD